MAAHERQLLCPSASEALPGSKVFGLIIEVSGPIRVGYLDKQARAELASRDAAVQVPLDRTNARFSALCQEGKCGNFGDGRCNLSREIVQVLPVVLDELPKCSIRSMCRWFSEEREQACLRCPQIATVSSESEFGVGVPLAPSEQQD